MLTIPAAHSERPTLAIRRMVSADLAQVMRIQQACYEPAFHEPHDAFAAKLHGSPETCWVACDGQHIYAYLVSLAITGDGVPALHATSWQAGTTPDWLYLHDLAIDPQIRGGGLSARLLDAAWAHACAQQLSEIGLIAVQGSEPFWAKQGFSPCGPSSRISASKLASFGADAVYMARKLTGPGR